MLVSHSRVKLLVMVKSPSPGLTGALIVNREGFRVDLPLDQFGTGEVKLGKPALELVLKGIDSK